MMHYVNNHLCHCILYISVLVSQLCAPSYAQSLNLTGYETQLLNKPVTVFEYSQNVAELGPIFAEIYALINKTPTGLLFSKLNQNDPLLNNFFSKKISLVSSDLDFGIGSWTTAPHHNTYIFFDQENLDKKDILMALVHEYAIYFDGKSQLQLFWPTSPAVVMALRILRAMGVEKKFVEELNELHQIEIQLGKNYDPLPFKNVKTCLETYQKVYNHIHKFNLAAVSPEDDKIIKILKKNNTCIYLSEPQINFSPLLDGSGPKPRGDGW